MIGSLSSRGWPSASSGYQTGIGTPKNRCRLTSQSLFRPFTQFSYRTRMWAGCQSISRPRASRRLRQARVAAAVAQVPLLAGDDLQRLAALLVEVDRVPDRLGVAEQVSRRSAAGR